MKKLIAGNWKMNGDNKSAKALVQDIIKDLDSQILEKADILVCPPSLYIDSIKQTLNDTSILIGAQDCSNKESGAYTGQISAAMLNDTGCSYVIVGHSERRQYNGETDQDISIKARNALNNGITPIICVGETLTERESGNEYSIIQEQLKHSIPENIQDDEDIVIAYEPVWAIGTGKTASPTDVEKMHSFIREKLKEHLAQSENIRILYGGSMKPENAKDLLSTPNVDGGLIGGASLKADQFIAIAKATLYI